METRVHPCLPLPPPSLDKGDELLHLLGLEKVQVCNLREGPEEDVRVCGPLVGWGPMVRGSRGMRVEVNSP